MNTAKRHNVVLKNELSHTWTGTDVFFVDDFRMNGAGYLNSSIVLTEATKSTNDKAEKIKIKFISVIKYQLIKTLTFVTS